MKENYIVVGLRVEHYMGEAVSGHNCDFRYEPEQRERHVLLLVREKDQQKVELKMWTKDGECGSGWCTATYGEFEHEEVSLFACKTHTCRPFSVEVDLDHDFKIQADDGTVVAEASYYGGCNYYPSGSAEANVSFFTLGGVIDEVAVRQFKKRPVLIFHGDSNTCKSHIAALTGKTVYETDAHDELNWDITEDIIVVGNRHGHDFETLKYCVHDWKNANIIEVNFKHSPNN